MLNMSDFRIMELLILFILQVICTTEKAFTYAFASHAGGCRAGNAVDGPHSCTTTRTLAQGNFQFLLDGTIALDPQKPARIQPSKVYTLSIVPSGDAYFRGALIRVEGEASFLEAGTNAANTDECRNTPGLYGVTHYNSDKKTEFTATLELDVQSDATIDVTLVGSLSCLDLGTASDVGGTYHDTFLVQASDTTSSPTTPPTPKPVPIPRIVRPPAPIVRPTPPPVRVSTPVVLPIGVPRASPVVLPVMVPRVAPVMVPARAPRAIPAVFPATAPMTTQVTAPMEATMVSPFATPEVVPIGNPVQISPMPNVSPMIAAPAVINGTIETIPTISNLITNEPTDSIVTIDTPMTVSNTTVDTPSDASMSGGPSQSASCTLRNKCTTKFFIGDCCPTTEGWTLQCCEDAVGQYQEACSSHPECDMPDISDACCPTADGKWLDCCSTVPDECQEAGKCPPYSSVRYALDLANAKNSKPSSNDINSTLLISVVAVVGIVGGGVLCMLVLGFITFRKAAKVATIGTVANVQSGIVAHGALHDPDIPSSPTGRRDLLPTGGSISAVDNTNQPPYQIPRSATGATSMFLPQLHPRYVVSYKDQSRSVMWRPKHVSMINGVPVQSTIPMVIARKINASIDENNAPMPRPKSVSNRHTAEA
jgi:hypothetical protein